jgi:hypothetical protein
MRSIFTYPNNLATSYIDPDYWSSDIADPATADDGYWKRIDDLRTGTYKASLSGSSWATSTDNIAKFTSMFNNGYYKDANISGDNLTIYDFWEMPQLVFERELVVNTISSIGHGGFLDSTDEVYRVGVQVERDITEVGDGTINAWQMPFGTEFDLGWNINTQRPANNRYNFFTNNQGSTDNGTMWLQTAAGTEGQPNTDNYYNFDASNVIDHSTFAAATTSGTSSSWDYIGLNGFVGSIIPTRSGSTKSITNGGKVLAYTNTGSDDWYYHMGDTSNFTDGDVVNPLTIRKSITGLNAAIDITQIGGMGNPIYGDVLDSETIKLYSDSGLTTPLSTTTGFDFLTPNISGWVDEFQASVYNVSGSTINNYDFFAIIGYSNTDPGYSPSPPAPEGPTPVGIGEKLIEYAKTWSPSGQYHNGIFPILVKTQSGISAIADWDIPSAGYRFYGGSYDYDNLAWARIHKDTINPAGYSSYTMYSISIWDKPTAASPGTQTVFNIHNTVNFTFAVPTADSVSAVFEPPATTLPAAPDNVATISTNEPARYRIKSNLDAQSGFGFGNKVYKNRTGASTYANAAVYNDVYYEPGSTNPASTTNEVGADISFVQDSNGYITGVGLGINSADSHGLYVNESDMIIVPETSPDTYTPPTPTPAEQEDIWDTDDEWASDGFAGGLKEWPDHVTPSTAVINYNSPTIVNNSQSGIKYTRSAGHTKWRLEVEYPPMSAEDFQKFHAIAQAAHGQSTPFYFNLNNKDGVSILWKDFYDQNNSTTSPRIKDPVTAGDTTLLVEGFSSNEADAFKRGEVFIDGNNENGYLHTSLSSTDANVYGEAKIRTPWPFRQGQSVGSKVYKRPTHATVTLGSDNFEYQVDVDNYYYVSVAFDLDDWK